MESTKPPRPLRVIEPGDSAPPAPRIPGISDELNQALADIDRALGAPLWPRPLRVIDGGQHG